MERREVFHILGAAAFQPQLPYIPKFFTPAEAQTVTQLGEVVIPGSRKAGIIRYIDLVLKYGDDPQQRAWQQGIAAVEEMSRQKFSREFAKLTAAEQDQIVASMAAEEGRRTDVAGRFFVTCKRLAVEAWHYSEAHWREDMKRGTTVAKANFPGCTHNHG
jgi:hypothetical protein